MKDIAIEREKKRLYALLESDNVPQNQREALESIICECAFMRAKLEETKESIKTSQVVIPFDNGGGQKGIRENPLFKGYEALFRSYLMGMDRIYSVLSKEAKDASRDLTTDNVIEKVRSMRKESVC